VNELPSVLPEWIYGPQGRLLCMALVMRRVPRNKVAMSMQKLMDLIEEDVALIRGVYPTFNFTLAAGTVLYQLIDSMVKDGILCQISQKVASRHEVTMSFADFKLERELQTKKFMASLPAEVRTFADLLPMSATGLLERIAEQS